MSQGKKSGSASGSQKAKLKTPLVDDRNIKDEQCAACHVCLSAILCFLIALTFPISIWFCIKYCNEYERAVVFRFGHVLGQPKGPGIFFVNPCIDKVTIVDIRLLMFDVAPQDILSKDCVTVTVDAILYFSIVDPNMAMVNVEDAYYSTQLLCQTMLRTVLGTKTLSEILSDRAIISQRLQTDFDKVTDPWGVKVDRMEIKDIRLPDELKRAMAVEAEAHRDARAKIIAAEGEFKAASSLKAAADTMAGSSCAIQLRYLQTLNTIAAEKKSTILFPLPMNVMLSSNN